MRIALLALSLLAATSVACHNRQTNTLGAAIASARAELADTAGDSAAITVKVQNLGFSEVTVYVLPEWGGKVRLGMVPAHADSVLDIPRNRVNPYVKVRFLLDPFGTSEESSLSEEIYIAPGDQVMLTLQPGR